MTKLLCGYGCGIGSIPEVNLHDLFLFEKFVLLFRYNLLMLLDYRGVRFLEELVLELVVFNLCLVDFGDLPNLVYCRNILSLQQCVFLLQLLILK